MTQSLRVDLLRGRKVRDPAGRVVGRICDLVAEVARPGSGEYLVREFHLSPVGFLERIGAHLLRRIVAERRGQSATVVVGWRDLDLSVPERPRLRRSLADAARESSTDR